MGLNKNILKEKGCRAPIWNSPSFYLNNIYGSILHIQHVPKNLRIHIPFILFYLILSYFFSLPRNESLLNFLTPDLLHSRSRSDVQFYVRFKVSLNSKRRSRTGRWFEGTFRATRVGRPRQADLALVRESRNVVGKFTYLRFGCCFLFPHVFQALVPACVVRHLYRSQGCRPCELGPLCIAGRRRPGV